MRGLPRFCSGSLVVLLLLLGAWSSGPEAGGPILKQRAESEVEIDLGMIVSDFVPLLAELSAADDEGAPEKIHALVELLGLNALERLHVQSSLDDQRGISLSTCTLDPSVDGGLLGDLFSIPSSRFSFGRYLREDDAALVVYAAGIDQRIAAIEKLFAQPEMRKLAPMAPTDPLGLTAMWGVDFRKEVLPHLSGEMGLLLFPCREEQSCEIPNAALVLGLHDGPSFREALLDVLSRMMGEERGAELRAMEGDPAGGFTFYPAWPGLAYAIANDFGVLTTDPEGMKGLVGRRGKGDLQAVEASTYIRANGDQILGLVSDMVARVGGDSPQLAVLTEMLEAVGEEQIGTIEMTGRTGNGRLEMELIAPASLYSAEYRLLKELLTAAPRLQALESRGADLREVVHHVDVALTGYGRERAGTFPESLEQLVEAGYLDALPDLVPTALGEYVDGGYTYVPLRDDAGKVVGHYFFVYGGGEHTGRDVFTEDNLADPRNFRVGRDGEADGVAGFSYDGIAIDHMEAWGN